MATHYEILGVSSQASPEVLRQAYLRLARQLHPDRTLGASAADAERAARRMQEVNEAWRVLKEPASRAAYDRWLAGARRPAAPPPPPHQPRHAAPRRAPFEALEDLDDEEWDRPFSPGPAEPVDVGVSVTRALPWLAVAVVLVGIFVFTAFADRSDRPEGPEALVGRCVSSGSASALVPVPCEGPNEGEVVLLVSRPSLCPDGSTGRAVEDSRWLCLKPHNDIPGPEEP